jgi:TMEM175 potassium channel family protein
MTEEDESIKWHEYGLDRTLAISDGVFAFAVTLLVLDLFVPTLSSGASSTDLWQALSKEYISFLNYILSFLIAGVWWNAHHRIFERIRTSNSTLRWLNLFFLLWIALLPFFTKILDQYSNVQLGVVMYAADQAASGLFLTLTWLYASSNHRLIEKNMPQRTIRFTTLRTAIAPIVFLISMGISFIGPNIAIYSWYGMIPALPIAHRLTRNDEKEQAKSENTVKS